MVYELYYWPTIQGRGEFVRLLLEQADARYRDVARETGKGAGVPALLRLLDGRRVVRAPFAPPFLKAGRLLIGQTANILQYPRAEARPCAERCGRTLVDAPAAAHDRGLRRRNPRHASSRVGQSLFRGAA